MKAPTTAAADVLVRGPAHLPPVVRTRDRGLRRALLIADVVALGVALVGSLLISGSRPHPFLEALWILPTLPAWVLVFRAYGLYRSPLRSFEPTHLDDLSSLVHALMIGTLGLWVLYKVAPVRRIDSHASPGDRWLPSAQRTGGRPRASQSFFPLRAGTMKSRTAWIIRTWRGRL